MELYIGSLFPSIIYLYIILVKEKYISKNYYLVFKASSYGVFLFLLAFVFEKILVLISDNLLYRAFVVAASTEEALRIILIFIFARNYKSDSLYEYLRSAISISIGFSSLENFAYVCYYFKGLETALERLYTAVPLHLLLGIVMASLLYRFKVSGRRFYLLLSFLVPVLFHGLYDYFCFTGYVIYAVLVLLVLFLFSFNLINKYFTFSVEERVQ